MSRCTCGSATGQSDWHCPIHNRKDTTPMSQSQSETRPPWETFTAGPFRIESDQPREIVSRTNFALVANDSVNAIRIASALNLLDGSNRALRAKLATAREACELALPIVAATCNALGECCLESDAKALDALQAALAAIDKEQA